MKLSNFKLERYFAKYEFTAKYLLSASDCEAITLGEVLSRISSEEKEEWKNLGLGYTESEGSSDLRKEIVKLYDQISVKNTVVASPGELNFSLMNVLLESKDHVICVHPCYQSLFEIAQNIGCDVSFWKVDNTNWKFHVDELISLITPSTKLIILNFPHNPTGAYLNRLEFEEIIEVARKHGIYIFSDEMYYKLNLTDNEEVPSVCQMYEKGVSLWGMSKSFGIAGLRIGWLASQDTKLIESVVKFKDYLSICNGVLSEKIAEYVLRESSFYIHKNIELIQSNIQLFNKLVDAHKDTLAFIPPKAGSTALLKLKTKESATEFCEKLVTKSGIMGLPSVLLDYPDTCIRIGFGRKNFSTVLDRFDSFLIEYN